MTEPAGLLVLMAVQALQSALVAVVLGWLLADVSRGEAHARHRMARLAFWVSALGPLAVMLPGALVVTWGPDATAVLTVRALAPPDLSDWNGPAAVVLWAIAPVTLWRLGRTAAAVRHGQRLAKAGVTPCRSVKALGLTTAAPKGKHLQVSVHGSVGGRMMTVGLWQPVVLIPPALVGSRDLEGYLRHEAAHVRLGHLRGALMQRLAEDLCWWNPGLRALGTMLAEQRELVCDAAAAGERPKSFAAGLVRAARAEQAPPRRAFGVGIIEGSIARRVERLLHPVRRMPGWAPLALVMALMVAMLPAPRREGASETRVGLASTPLARF